MATPTDPAHEGKLLNALYHWQRLERDAIATMDSVRAKTRNPLIRLIMEIIRNDSVQHHRVQQFLIDAMTKEAVTVSPDELAEIWTQIEAHDEAEKQTIALAKECVGESRSFVHKAILNYLLRDEEKHDHILRELDAFKRNITSPS
jgi:hypothetical protein